MKARVRNGGAQKLKVGSNLEFLKVGRKLQIEDLEAGGRREARIDGVEVVVDPSTQVPQLVVALRYEGVEDTPEPAVIDLGGEPVKAASLVLDASAVTASAHGAPAASSKTSTEAGSDDGAEATSHDTTPSGDVPAASDDDLDDAIPAATRAARRLGNAAEQAGEKAREASIAAAKLGSSALSGMTKLFGGAAAKFAAFRAGKQENVKRRTSPPPEGPMSVEGKRLRPQTSKRDEKSDDSPAPAAALRLTKPRALVAAAGIAILGTTVVLATRSEKPDSEKQASAEPVRETGEKTASAAAAPASDVPASSPGAPVTANVPLFGPTPMATSEPAPLGPPPTAEGRAVEDAERAAAKAAEPEAPEDEEFVDEPAGKGAQKASSDRSGKDAKPEDVPAFGRGKLHLPTIHRIRLDGPGSAINGAFDPMGFTVLIPKRKLMEQGNGIAKRDARFARVRTTNTPDGAQLRVAFNGTVPAYRVRLRRDYVELLVSAAEESKDKKSSKKAPAASKVKVVGKLPAAR
jgi:hypothetical protein